MLRRSNVAVFRSWSTILRLATFTLVVLLLPASAFAQGPLNSPSQILQQYQTQQLAWLGAVQASATRLFTLLAGIEVAWTLTLVVLERADFHSLAATLVRKIMWIGIFYALLINGQNWIPWIIQSFAILGQRAAGVNGTVAPSNVLSMGLNIFGALLSGASNAGFLTNFGTAVSLVLAAFVTLLAYVVITIQFVAAMVESYIVIAAGFIFLGFGGSRWTMPYVERYIGLAVSIGVKLMILYLLIGVGMNLSNGWLNAATQVATSPAPAMSAGDIAAACIIFMALCWMAPKLISSVIGGSPAFSGGDLLSPPMQAAAATATVGALAFAGAGAVVAAGRAGISSVRGATSFAGRALSSRSTPLALSEGSSLVGSAKNGKNLGFSSPRTLGVGQVPAPKSAQSSGSSEGQMSARRVGSQQRTSGTRQQPGSSLSGSPRTGLPENSGSSPLQGGTAGGDVLGKAESAARRASQGLRRVRDDLNKFRVSDGGHHPSPPPGFGSDSGSGGSE
jgi:type IV secretion system protein TrbL